MPQTAAASSPHNRWADAAAPSLPALLHGLRFAAASLLALYAAFALELDNASWAATSAAIVCLPVLGCSLRKAAVQMIGTVTGACATVLLTGCFPQDHLAVLIGVAACCGSCAVMATLLRNSAAHAALLAGTTMAIIAATSIDAPGEALIIALNRACEIGVGIAAATLVQAVTSIGRAPLGLGLQLALLISETLRGFGATLGAAGGLRPDSRPQRWDLLRRAAGLDALIDQAASESSAVRAGRGLLEAGLGGLFGAVSSWRVVATHLAALPPDEARNSARLIMARLPPFLRGDVKMTGTAALQVETCRLACGEARRHLLRLAADGLSLRLLADATAEALGSLEASCNALLLIAAPSLARPVRRRPRAVIADPLPALVNGLRVFAAIAAASLLWIVTAWPSGPLAITFVAVTMLLQAPCDEDGLRASVGVGVGTVLAAVLAAIVNLALLPGREGFLSFTLVIGLVLVPLGAFSTLPGYLSVCGAASVTFMPLLSPANAASLEPLAFTDSTMAIVGGCLFGAAMLRLLPPVPPGERTRRLRDLTLRDLRRLAVRRRDFGRGAWQASIHARLLALPSGADGEDGVRIVAALSVGLQVIRLRRLSRRLLPRLDREALRLFDLDGVLRALVPGQGELFLEGLARLDTALQARQEDAAASSASPGLRRGLVRMRAAIVIIRETVQRHGDYVFGARPAPPRPEPWRR
jgi:uncharacterized membrane protein YccC